MINPALRWAACLTLGVIVNSMTFADDRPNIVLILSDDQAWSDYSFMGHAHIRTPHIDRLAREGATFRRGYVPTALCRPSLASILTGHYPSTHGIIGNDPAKSSVDDAQ